MIADRCFKSQRRASSFLEPWLEMQSHYFCLTQAIVTQKSLSCCDIPFRFLTVGFIVWEGAQTAKVISGSSLA